MAESPAAALVLGSASPRRAALLATLGVPFVVETIDIDERSMVDEQATGSNLVAQIASAKFAAFTATGAVAGDQSMLLATADTLVECDGAVMGKPESIAETATMLRVMSGRPLIISTAVCVGRPGTEPMPVAVATVVTLRQLSESEINRYAQTGIGLDKAGGLALQSEANSFIESIDGCWSNVLGLPLCATAAALDLAPHEMSRQQRCSPDLCGSSRY